MKLKIFAVCVLLNILPCILPVNADTTKLAVIPQPAEVIEGNGIFNLGELSSYRLDQRLANDEKVLTGILKKEGFDLKPQNNAEASLDIKLDEKLNDESYKLTISDKRIIIEGGRAGVFYGMQTLLQLIMSNAKELRACEIIDSPRYAWRGFMVDESRHFFGKEKIKETLDMMALLKLNRFHWHLTDEPGWRIEIPKYPLLTVIGAQGCWSNDFDPTLRFYTEADIKEIVAYASERHIQIIPEIDMPGHATSATKAYPEFDGGGTEEHPSYTFNVGKEKTYSFLTDILRYVTTLFPAQWLHIGGDEVAFGIEAWKTNSDIQKLIKKENLDGVKGAESYFMNRMADSIHVLNRKQIAWDEILDLNLPTNNTIVMWWRHDRKNLLLKSLNNGYKTILCPRLPMYFDFIQAEGQKHGRTWNGFCPLEDVYAFPEGTLNMSDYSNDDKKLIIGVQANLWTERIQNNLRFDFMTYPRLCALAEACWTTPSRKDYDIFTKNMEVFYSLFDRLGIYYYNPNNPQMHPEPISLDKNKKKVPMDFRD